MLRISTKATLFALAVVPLACGVDSSGQNDGGTGDSSDTGGDNDDDDDDSITDPDATATDAETGAADADTSATDPDTSATEPTTDTGPQCTPDDDCDEDSDCAPGQSCIGCLCYGIPMGCADYGEGVFGDCVTEGNASCESANGSCIVDNPGAATAGVCFFACEQACDCPQPPAGFEEQLACEDLTDDAMPDCFIDCAGGAACPDGMYCYLGTLCFFGEAPAGAPPYGDCINNGGQGCQDAICLTGPGAAVCGEACMDVGDCTDAPATGNAPVTCDDITDDGMNECFLECSGGGTCPDGMACVFDYLCVWEEMDDPPPPGAGYGDCANNPPNACSAAEECISDAEGAVCAGSDCGDVGDCEAAPATGDAPVSCGDIGGAGGTNSCYLDCAGGQTCPDDMVCSDGGYCQWADAGMTLDEDFEGGALPPGWSVLDVDDQTPAAQVSFVDQAWVVTDVFQAGTNFAAYSTSWYMPPGQSDDWLITPQFVVGPTSVLSWSAGSPDPMYPDGYEVRISTLGTNPADFMAEAALFTIANEAQNLTQHMVDLAAGYAGETVYIAWRNTSNDEFVLLVDDVQITD